VNSFQLLKITQLSDAEQPLPAFRELFTSLETDLAPETLEDLKEAVLIREEASSTYLDQGLAVPHGRIDSLDQVVIAVGLNENGIQWPDAGRKAHLIIMLGVPDSMITGYLVMMQKILRWHKQSKLIDASGNITDPGLLEKELRDVLG
jgi:mannitol/fructose-specific phosphotransferase system IIA component (Ntr-type)